MAEWRKIPEAGTVAGIRLLVLVARAFGRRIAGWMLYVVAFYYALIRGTARRASRDYLRRIGARPSFANVVRHLQTFAQVSLDRMFFLTGRWESFRFEHTNHDGLVEAAKSGRGVLLLGAHLGSFEVMRCRAKEFGVPINVVVDFSNAERINAVLRSLSPDADTRLISLGEDPVTAMLEIRAAIDRGELVAILGDRQPESSASDRADKADRADRPDQADGRDPAGPPAPRAALEKPDRPGTPAKPRVVISRFLGEDAAFPAGPWLLAHTLRCPVYFVAGVYTAPNLYSLHFELLSDEVRLDRQERAASLARYAQRYASMLETYVRSAPLNWFNFFDFWSRP